ncbi:conserved hypothetical protein [Talaromyces stipitatus ATCC 10500]|uniref:C2H2 finger domain protein n=1 Tax=Talaromyces stipitatus (strain ATCC 10500 / CBS 375.48 / QM 6759 / NRRL 1006) TaxID=441959 RepID=B8MJS1_TALSN|nr:uncharacterized protein TSTA_042130 [Talaromyces stipitatus ATCC 10500]EED14738.1 conserved hypothetical protein [Talaromyces stipitatus ATCC 10500]
MSVKTRVRQQAPPLRESIDPDDDYDAAAVHEGDESSSSSDSDSDRSDDDYERDDGYSTTLTEPDSNAQPCLPALLPSQRLRNPPSSASKRKKTSVVPSELPEYSDDPNDDTDEDIANVPLDYGRSDNTKTRRSQIKTLWQKYCAVKAAEQDAPPKWSNAEQALRQATTNNIHRFFIIKGSALEADWKALQGYYRLITRTSFNKVQCEEINAGLRSLMDKWKLDMEEREKTGVHVQDLTAFNETVLRTTEKRFHLGFERIQICLFTILGIFTVNRISALLSLQFKHLQFSLQRDPLGGPPIPMVELRAVHTKQFLGITQHNNFPFPEIVDDPTLIFSPHVFLFSILFYLDAFEANGLRSMEDVRRLLVEDGCEQMELYLKPEIEEYFLFCMTTIVDGTPMIQWNRPINASTMSARLQSLGEIHGWLHIFFAHRMRYGGGKQLNESGCVSEAQQNLIMKHASSRTFLNHYLPRNIDTDMQNIMNGRKPNTMLMHAIRRISRWIDKRRPRVISAQDRAELYQHPEYLAAVHERDAQAILCQQSPSPRNMSRLGRLTQDVDKIFRRLCRVRRKEVRQAFSRKQAKIDIERQRSGTAFHNEETKHNLQTVTQMPSEMIHLLEKLFTWPTSHSLNNEWKRRNAATAAVTQYCGVWEGGPLRGRRKRASPSDDELDQMKPSKRVASATPVSDVAPSDSRDLLEEAREHIIRAGERDRKKPNVEKPIVCFQCFGNRLLPEHKRVKKWSRPDATVRHFQDKHLADRQCNFCDDGEIFLHQMHLQNHAAAVHRLVTGSRGC